MELSSWNRCLVIRYRGEFNPVSMGQSACPPAWLLHRGAGHPLAGRPPRPPALSSRRTGGEVSRRPAGRGSPRRHAETAMNPERGKSGELGGPGRISTETNGWEGLAKVFSPRRHADGDVQSRTSVRTMRKTKAEQKRGSKFIFRIALEICFYYAAPGCFPGVCHALRSGNWFPSAWRGTWRRW